MSNTINVRRFIKENSEMNSNPKAIQSLKTLMEKYGKELILKAEEKVRERKQKTIKGDDFNNEEEDSEQIPELKAGLD